VRSAASSSQPIETTVRALSSRSPRTRGRCAVWMSLLTHRACWRPVRVMSDVGGPDRVEEVYREVHPRLWRALLAYTGDRELASDAEAEAFAQALRRGDAIVDVEAWVWRSAFRIARGLLSVRSTSSGVSSIEHVPPASGSVVEFLGLLTNLPAQQRACVALRYLGDYTSREIAEMLGTSAGTVRVQLSRAHAALRGSIEEAASA
jgi:DNA-directed RNA polymerase specialized sigma24 family protein